MMKGTFDLVSRSNPPIEASAAFFLAGRIRALVPDWIESSQQPGHWRFTDPDPDYATPQGHGRYVEVDGRVRDHVVVADPMIGTHVGPSLLGFVQNVTVIVVLPWVSDRTDMRNALDAMRAVDAFPPSPG